MTESKICTCPSGDGSLRWPCPAHPAEQAGGDERAAFEAWMTWLMDHVYGRLPDFTLDDGSGAHYVNADVSYAWTAWQARAALAQPSPTTDSRPAEWSSYDTTWVVDFIRDNSIFNADLIERMLEYATRPAGDVPQAWLDVQAERRRQVEAEGWTPEHDDEHACDEIAAFACFYAMPPAARDWDTSSTGYGDTLGEAILPEGWEPKTGDRRRELVKAGGLILAEIERLDRAEPGKEGM
ncbi:TPA: hypothetical protein N1999_002140 [Pseudomonas aeruginosa]|nr:hypothetical protein [Pseudomonas aeruginosa]